MKTAWLGLALVAGVWNARLQFDKAALAMAATPESPGQAAAGIQWYATWESGLAEAQRTGRPILFVAAAPHCAGVSGMW